MSELIWAGYFLLGVALLVGARLLLGRAVALSQAERELELATRLADLIVEGVEQWGKTAGKTGPEKLALAQAYLRHELVVRGIDLEQVLVRQLIERAVGYVNWKDEMAAVPKEETGEPDAGE